jgi:hypothetical protein
MIGDYKSPVNILPRGEIPGLFTPTFWRLFEIWKFFHYGFGLPSGMNWDDLPEDEGHILLAMEMHFQKNFTMDVVSVSYQKAQLELLQAVHTKRGRGKR